MEGRAIGPIYHASYRVQRGSGIGSYLGGLIRILRPLFIKGMHAVGRETLRTAGNVLTDISLKKKQTKKLVTLLEIISSKQ